MFEYIFEISLILTFIITRSITHSLHDYKNPKNYNKKTLTGKLREKTQMEIHHFHFGIILLFISLIVYFLFGINNLFLLLLGISLSLIFDQLIPILNLAHYFKLKAILFAIVFHLIILIIVIMLKTSIF